MPSPIRLKTQSDYPTVKYTPPNVLPNVLGMDQTPPAIPNIGDAYVVAPGGIGAWLGYDNQHATWSGAVWNFTVPAYKDRVFVTIGTPWALEGWLEYGLDDIWAKAKGSYTDYIPLAPNYNILTLVNNGLVQVNGISFAAVLPIGTLAVVLQIDFASTVAAAGNIDIFTDQALFPGLYGSARDTTAAGGYMINKHITLPIDSDLSLDYIMNQAIGGVQICDISIIGYYI